MYSEDLAFIHDAGFGGLAGAAATVLRKALQRQGLRQGLVVDLGCGSGILAAAMAGAGYDVLGIDVAPAMLEIARTRVPGGRFRQATARSARLPRCVAVAAVGEVLNYLVDGRETPETAARIIQRAATALVPGGVLLLDVAGPGRVPGPGPTRNHAIGADWAVLATSSVDPATQILTRSIVNFRRDSAQGLYRRTEETHRQRLIPPGEISEAMKASGFAVRRLKAYGRLRLGRAVTGFLGLRP